MSVDYNDMQILKKGYIESNSKLQKSIEELEELAQEKSQAERDYRVSVMKSILSLKSEGMAATLIPALAKGSCSDALFNRDHTKALYDVGREKIKAITLNIESYRTLISVAKAEINIR